MPGVFRDEITPLIASYMDRLLMTDNEASNTRLMRAGYITVSNSAATLTNITGLSSVSRISAGKYTVNFSSAAVGSDDMVIFLQPQISLATRADMNSNGDYGAWVSITGKTTSSVTFQVTYFDGSSVAYFPDGTYDIIIRVMALCTVSTVMWVDGVTQLKESTLNALVAGGSYNQQALRVCGALLDLSGQSVQDITGVTSVAETSGGSQIYEVMLDNAFADLPMWGLTHEYIGLASAIAETPIVVSMPSDKSVRVAIVDRTNAKQDASPRKLHLIGWGYGGF